MFRLSANRNGGEAAAAALGLRIVCVMGVVVGGVFVLSIVSPHYDCFIHHNLSYQLPVCNSYVQYVRRPQCRYPIKYYLIRKKK